MARRGEAAGTEEDRHADEPGGILEFRRLGGRITLSRPVRKSEPESFQRKSAAVRGCCELAEIKLQEGESIENALRRFKRKVQQEDIIKDIKKHSFYLKPGDKKRAKQALARKRNRKKIRREAE